MSPSAQALVLVLCLASAPATGSARAQDLGPIATHKQGAAPAAPAPRADASPPEADPFAWLRTPAVPEAERWRMSELQQEQRWLQADRNFPILLEQAGALEDRGPAVQIAGGRIYSRSVSADGRRAWTSRDVLETAASKTGARAEPALAPPTEAPSSGQARVICGPGSERLCLLARRAESGWSFSSYDAATGTAGRDPFQLPSSTQDVALESDAALLAVLPEDGVPVVRRVAPGRPTRSEPVVFRGAAGDEITPGAAVGRGGDHISWLTVRRPDGRVTLLVYADGMFRPLAAPAGSEIVGVVGDQLVVQLHDGWRGVDALPAGTLLSFDLKPLLTRAAELTPHVVLRLSATPDIRQAAATRSALLLVAREGAVEVAYLCEPGLRGWSVRRLESTAASRLEIAAAGAAGDAAVLRSPAFPEGDRLQRLDTRTGVVTPLSSAVEDFSGHPRQRLTATALDGGRVQYTLIGGPGAGGALRPVLLMAPPQDAQELAVLRMLGALWLSHGGDLAISGSRQRRYVDQEGLAGVLVGYEDLSSIARDLSARGLVGEGGVSLAGHRTSASLAAIDVVKHPGQWAAAVLIDPVADPVGATAEPAEPWAQPFASARESVARKAWRRIAPYDNLRSGARYAPVLTVGTPTADPVFASDGARFTARLNSVGGDSLHVTADGDGRACAVAVAFLLRVLGVTG